MRNFWSALKAVFSAFAGIRRTSAADLPHLRPHHYIIAGVVAVLMLIALLLAVVHAVV